MAKRKRELEALEACREMAKNTAPLTLLAIALDTTRELLATVDSAHKTLGAVAQTLRIFVDRATRGIVVIDASSADDSKQFGGAFATSLLDDALSELARLLALHHGLKLAYSCCSVSVPHKVRDSDGHLRPSPMANWQAHRRDALRHARDARRMLRSAASIARAIEDAARLFMAFPVGSPDWTTWTSAAMRLARHAAVSAALALRALRRMRDAVALEFCNAWRVVNVI